MARDPRWAGSASRWAPAAGALLGAALVFALGVAGTAGPITGVSISWTFVALGSFAAETWPITVDDSGEPRSFPLTQVPLTLGLFFLAPAAAVLAQVTGVGAALIWARVTPRDGLLRVGRTGLAAGAAVMLFSAIAGGETTSSVVAPWTGAGLAGLAAWAVGSVFDLAVLAWSSGTLRDRDRSRQLLAGFLVALFSTSLGLIASTIIWFDPRGAWLLLVPSITLLLAYRAYSWQRQKNASLEGLYESTRVIHRTLQAEPAMRDLLSQARKMFRCRLAEIVLFAGDEDDLHVQATLVRVNDFSIKKYTVLDPQEGLRARVASEDCPILFARPIKDKTVRRSLGHAGLRDAMIAPLHGERGVIGTILVGNRSGAHGTFRRSDMRLLETLASHSSVALENARLVDRLREEAAESEFQAMHDALTGLPNRALLRDRLQQAVLVARRDGSRVAVMVMDLDRFKEVNDTLGHHRGDLVLQEVAARLRTTLRQSDTAARLSGDEFAMVASRAQDVRGATLIAEKTLECVGAPFVAQGVGLDLRASIGIAFYPEHGEDAGALMQRADVAMYHAKSEHTGFEFYTAERDLDSPTRLALAGELRRGIEEDEVLVHFQPEVELSSGRVRSAEALVRWRHPTRGLLNPDEFVGLAENAGLMRPLTLAVLSRALQQSRAWRREGIDIDVAVNLSVTGLGPRLPDELDAMLGHEKVPPDRLVLEIAESSIADDPVRSMELIDRLDQSGVGVAIDHFGIGDLSPSLLKRLPVKKIKIDSSLVAALASGAGDGMVRATVDLGRSLGARVAAEGVESKEMLEKLDSLGCDRAQGFYLSRPRPGPELGHWLTKRDRRVADRS